ncbi:glycoside hydrolase family 88 protein [Lentzea sp.]|uniref:glycoside hydrolase family 88 protein n=1 Tax=Lentzea sp. TaxID=56099 RepID=UPI002C1E5709|nr:glycoside hydrolase family 88 protein [Lentzea sp.]HUQ54049.1 glycoside hydrolase family 88 protein [Lentzea sp.]
MRTPLSVAALAGSLLIAPAAAQAVPCAVTDTMVEASAAWVTRGTGLAENTWSNAGFHVGNLAQVRTTGVSNHKTWPWVQANGYLLPLDPANPYAPDAQATGEPYLDVAYFHPEPEVLQPLRDNLRAQVADGGTGYWKSPDALNMALPSFTRVAVADDDKAMLDYSYRSYRSLKSRTFNELTGLWSLNVQTNGWAVQGLAKAVLALPAGNPYRADYASTLRRTAQTLRFLQRHDGFWGAAGKDSAATAMITYAFAAGINEGVLDRDTYLPAVRRGWQALQTALDAGGLLGWTAARDSWKPASAGDSAGFAVGSFLLAGQQVVRLTPGC